MMMQPDEDAFEQIEHDDNMQDESQSHRSGSSTRQRSSAAKRARAAEDDDGASTAAAASHTAESPPIAPSSPVSDADRSVRQRVSSPQPAQARLSPTDHFLRAFSRDQDSWFHLLHTKLNLTDIAVLHQLCQTTRRWIEQPSSLMRASKRTRVVSPVQLESLHKHNCQWVLPFVMQIKINLRPVVPGGPPSAVPPPLAAPLLSVIESLARFPHLARLGIQLCSVDAGREEMKALFARLSHIQHLDLLMAGVAPEPPAAEGGAAPAAAASKGCAAAAAFLELGALQNLESFTVSNADELPSTFNFEALPTLPRLKQLSITLSRGPNPLPGAGPRSFHCSAMQSKMLGQCKQMTHLRCGVWSQPATMTDPARSQMIIRTGVASLIGYKIVALRDAQRLFKQQMDEAAQAGRSGSQLNLIPSAQPLQLLALEGTVISAGVFEFLSRMPSLVTLNPYAWRSDIPREKWARLAAFKNLRSFSLMTHPADVYSEHPISSDDVLPPLMHCSLLQTLHLQSVSISTIQLAEIVKRLPHLKHLSLRALHVESLAPLANAKKLCALSLHFCTHTQSVAGAHPSVSLRESFPPMPHLWSLLIFDRVRISAATAAPLNAALFARLPSLKPSAFHQNLLAELPPATTNDTASVAGAAPPAAAATAAAATVAASSS